MHAWGQQSSAIWLLAASTRGACPAFLAKLSSRLRGSWQPWHHSWVGGCGRATGATALVKLGAPGADELGYAKSLKVVEIGGSQVRNPRRAPGGAATPSPLLSAVLQTSGLRAGPHNKMRQLLVCPQVKEYDTSARGRACGSRPLRRARIYWTCSKRATSS